MAAASRTESPLPPARPPGGRRALALCALTLVAWAVVRTILTVWPAEVLAREKPEFQVGWGERLLVVAPHPDDETLAAAGLIQRVLARHGRVRVVVLTSGDAYSLAARRYFRRATLSPQDLLRFGSLRMAEARQAAQGLGLDPRDLLFLGFPDRCLARLLRSGAAASPYTGASSVPYPECLHPGAPYSAQELEEQLKTAVASFRPTLVLLPSPRDGHPDHRAAHHLAQEALATLPRHAPGDAPPRVLTYLVHPPARSRAVEQYLGLPTTMEAAAEADYLALTPAERANKRHALGAYLTQRAIWSNLFLDSFLGPVEVFTPLR